MTDNEYQLLITPTLAEFVPHRWQEYTRSMLVVHRRHESGWVHRFEYEVASWEGWATPIYSQRWYIFQREGINSYVQLFLFPARMNKKQAQSEVANRIVKFQNFSETKAVLVYSLEGKLI